jgi:hypothetical protein
LALKITVFLCYIKKGAILTKDNLTPQKIEKVAQNVVFFNSEKTIQHLFFDCTLTRSIWNVFFLSFRIQPPSSTANLFGSWPANFSLKL